MSAAPQVFDAPTHYDTLGVSPDADEATIKKSYRRLMMRLHPDVCREPDAASRAADCTIAFGVLSDPKLRAEYDDALAGGGAPEPVAFADAWGDELDPNSLVEPDPGTPAGVGPDEFEQVLDDEVVESDEQVLQQGHPGPTAPRPPHLVSPPKAWPSLLVFAGLALLVLPGLSAIGRKNPAAWVSGQGPVLLLVLYCGVPAIAWVLGIVAAARGASDVPHARALPRLVASGAFLLVALALLLLAPQVGIVALVGASAAAAYLPLWQVFSTRKLVKALNRVVPADTLMRADRFGGLPGTVCADQVDLALDSMHAGLPALKILMCADPDAWFSHAVVLSDHLVLVRGVLGPAGRYRWSGPSLLADTGAHLPVEVDATGGMDERVDQVRKVFGERVSAVLCVVEADAGDVFGTSADGVHPAVVGVDAIEEWVGRKLVDDVADPSAVSHETVARAWSALNA